MCDLLEATHRGHFGYEVINSDLIIPYTYRGDLKLCPTKVFLWHFGKENISLSADLIKFDYLRGFAMLPQEIRLWNEINHFHNDTMYIIYLSEGKDTLVKMQDVRDIFKYIDDCKQQLQHGAHIQNACGMARIWLPATKTEIILPFVLKNGQRYVPSEIPKVPKTLDATTLTGIEAMYMQFLFDVMKVPLSSDIFEIPCVRLDEVVAHLKSQTNGNIDYADDYWPGQWPLMGNSDNLDNNNDIPLLTTTTQESNNKSSDAPKETDVQRFKRKQTNTKAEKVKKPKKAEPVFYEVENLLDYTKDKKGKEMVLVHWKGYPPESDSWEPIDNLNDALADDLDILRKNWSSKKIK